MAAMSWRAVAVWLIFSVIWTLLLVAALVQQHVGL